MSAKTYMLDTNIFNGIVNGTIRSDSLAGLRCIATSVQREELKNTSCLARRQKLLLCFAEVSPEVISGASFCFGVPGAGWGQATWNDGTGRFEKMLIRLKELDRKSKKRKEHVNQLSDIVIAETALVHGVTLLTDDDALQNVVEEFGGHVMTSSQALLYLEPER